MMNLRGNHHGNNQDFKKWFESKNGTGDEHEGKVYLPHLLTSKIEFDSYFRGFIRMV
ncbi:hypothetical protein JYB64_05285 [Algoriphagus aestuarii]|nr:hypothetical protein [Algoriphagus aestuarii]